MNKQILLNSIFFVLGLFFVLSCEEEASDDKVDINNSLTVKSSLNDAETAYTFYVNTFVKDNKVLYDSGRVDDTDDVKMEKEWNQVILRWGFRSKSSNGKGKIYWVQTTQGDSDSQNSYEKKVSGEKKASFIPVDLPDALLNKDAIEVYVVAQLGEKKVTGAINLPGDFKEKVLNASIISGALFNKTARNADRTNELQVEGALIYAVHKSTGKIFHSFSRKDGKYSVTVRHKGPFYLVFLHSGFLSVVRSTNLVGGGSHYIDLTEEDSTNTSDQINKNQLYKVSTDANTLGTFETHTGTGYDVSGNAVDADAKSPTMGTGLAATFLLLFERQKDELYFLLSTDTGNFSFKMPLDATVKETDVTTLSVAAAAYGYLPNNGSERLDGSRSGTEIFRAMGFDLDPAFDVRPSVSWGPRTSGGPSGFPSKDDKGKEVALNLHFDGNTDVVVKMEFLAAGPFLADNTAVVWKKGGSVVGQTGRSASFTLNTAGETTISAEITDIRMNKVTLERSFNLSSSSTIKPDDPAVQVGEDTVTDGKLTGPGLIDASGTLAYLRPSIEAVDPDTGNNTGLIYTWTVTHGGIDTSVYSKAPNLKLKLGSNVVKLEVTTQDRLNTRTISKTYTVS